NELKLAHEMIDPTADGERLVGSELASRAIGLAGDLLLRDGRLTDAASKLTQALELSRRAHPGPHAETADRLHLLAEALRRSGRLDEAESCLREAVAMYRAHPEWPNDVGRVNSEWFLVLTLLDAGKFDAAVASAQEEVAIVARLYPESDFLACA